MKVITKTIYVDSSGKEHDSELSCLKRDNELLLENVKALKLSLGVKENATLEDINKNTRIKCVIQNLEKEKDSLELDVKKLKRECSEREYELKRYKKHTNRLLSMLYSIPRAPGVYKYTNHGDNDKVYVGSAEDLKSRTAYVFGSKSTNYGGKEITEALQKYPIECWEVAILELCDMSKLEEREDYYIEKYDARNPEKGYNVHKAKRKKKSKTSAEPEKVPRTFSNIYEHLLYGIKFLGFMTNELPLQLMNRINKLKERGEGIVTYLPFIVFSKRTDFSVDLLHLLPRNVVQQFRPHLICLHSVRKDPENPELKWGYSFMSVYGTDAKVTSFGYETEKDAFFGMLEGKRNIIRELAEKGKDAMDEYSYNVLMGLTIEDIMKIGLLSRVIGRVYEFWPTALEDITPLDDRDVLYDVIVKSEEGMYPVTIDWTGCERPPQQSTNSCGYPHLARFNNE